MLCQLPRQPAGSQPRVEAPVLAPATPSQPFQVPSIQHPSSIPPAAHHHRHEYSLPLTGTHIATNDDRSTIPAPATQGSSPIAQQPEQTPLNPPPP